VVLPPALLETAFTKHFRKSYARSEHLASQTPASTNFLWSNFYQEGVAHTAALSGQLSPWPGNVALRWYWISATVKVLQHFDDDSMLTGDY
jgi:hypothetical protein